MKKADGGCGHPAAEFLQLLGKEPSQTYFRTIRHGKGANSSRRGKDLQGLDLEALNRDNQAGESVYFVTGNSTTASGVNKKTGKPTGCVWEGDITSCPALFAEWDGKPIEWQLQAWQELGLPEPTIQLWTGGKSVHCYWLLTEAMAPAQWRPLQAWLIDHCESDQACKDPNRLMRLPGFAYLDKKTGKPNGHTAQVVHTSNSRYSAAEIEASLPSLLPPPPAPAAPAPARALRRHTLQEIEAAAAYIPERVVGGNTYEPCRNALCGCAAALAEIGLPDDQALDLLGGKWPDRATAQQVLQSSTTREAKSFWAIAKEHGYQQARQSSTTRQQQAPDAAPHRPASLQALIQQLPDGWDANTLKPQMMSAGRLADMLPAAALRFNEMTLRAEVHTSSGWQRITDADLDSAYVVLSGKGWKVGSEPVIKAIIHTARQAPHHPVRAYLQQVEADPSIAPFDLDQVAPQFFRASKRLHVEMVRKWLIGAVSRALDPGSQMDYVLVLKGGQGQRKSRSLEALASPDWYCSSIPENEKDLLLNIHGTWIYELAELESVTSRKESGRLKNLITTSADLVRVPYGRTSERMARQSVFCATVNEDTFLRDDTGNRRFWVVAVDGLDQLDRAGLLAARNAIWKAAVAAYRADELPMLSMEMESLSSQQNQEFNQQDPWVEMVLGWMDGDPLHRWDPERDPSTVTYDPGEPFTSAEVLYSAGLRRLDQITRADEMRVAAVLRQLKFDRRQKRVDGRVDRFWMLSQPSQPQEAEVVTPETPAAAVGLVVLSQPSQPISKERELKSKGGSAPAPSGISQESFEKSHRGCDTLTTSVALQSFQPSQPAFREVVTPLEVVTPTTATEWADAALTELRLAPRVSHLEDVMAWINRQPTNPGITRTHLAGVLERLEREDLEADQLGLEVA
jgi:predicted P-loop ATPase